MLLAAEEGHAGPDTDRKISRRSEKLETNRVSSWTFQRFSALLDHRAITGERLQLDGGTRPDLVSRE